MQSVLYNPDTQMDSEWVTAERAGIQHQASCYALIICCKRNTSSRALWNPLMIRRNECMSHGNNTDLCNLSMSQRRYHSNRVCLIKYGSRDFLFFFPLELIWAFRVGMTTGYWASALICMLIDLTGAVC